MSLRERLQQLWISFADAPRPWRYGVAVAVTLMATALRIALNPLWGQGFPMVFFFPATLFVALLGGIGPGLVSVAIGTTAAAIFVVPISDSSDFLGVLAYTMMDCAAAWMGSVHRNSWKIVAQQTDKLRNREAELLRALGQLETEGEKRIEAEARLRQAHKMEAIGQLTGGISHDFGNLLTVIIGNLDAIERRLAMAQESGDGRAAVLAATLQRPIESALRGADRATELTRRLLAFGRRQPLAPEILNINKMVAGLTEMMRRTLGETIEIEAVLGGGLWDVFVDVNQLENVLLNLALNARDAMPDGGKLTVETASTHLDESYVAALMPVEEGVPAGQYVLLSVTDTGIGMTPEILAQAFDPFFTTKEVGKGTGLGLSMVHGVVKQSGGHIRIYSEAGEGTTVKIYLPRHRADSLAERATSLPVPAAILRARPGETVLLVEDDIDVREYAIASLEDLGYQVLEAADAAMALRLLDAEPDRRIDLLFTDVVLPGGASGRDLADQAALRRPGLPVLFTTGYSRNAIVHQGRLDPDVHVLVKPYRLEALAAKIRELLDTAPRSATGAGETPPV